MDVKNTKLKKIIVIGIVFIGIFGLIRNYNKYKEIKNNQKILIENRDELNKKILEIEKQREMENKNEELNDVSNSSFDARVFVSCLCVPRC